MEVLSPAGSPEALKAAVYSGADAVYFGAGAFNARSNAINFNEDEIKNNIIFCHERGVKVYATLNTLINDREFTEALHLAESFTRAGIDAFITQDMGLSIALKNISDVPLHASTQLSIHSLDGVIALHDIGFSRVVLARELSENDINYITHHAPNGIEIEVFVHGALCMSYSGQCYMSSIIGGRSGNRGMCAQPCRLPYKKGFALSLKDLCLIEYIDKLKNIGVTSIKIEGRMKSPEYVAAVTEIYAAINKGEPYSPEKKEYLAGIFSRGGFTDGYFTGNIGKDMFGVRSETSQTHPIKSKEYKRIGLTCNITPEEEKKILCSLITDDGFSAEGIIEGVTAEKTPTSPDDIKNVFEKLGDTIYFLNNFSCKLPENIFIPFSPLNKIRRELISKITAMRLINIKKFRNSAIYLNSFKNKIKSNTLDQIIKGQFYNINAIPENAELLDFMWIPITKIRNKETTKILTKYKNKIGVFLPRVVHDSEYNELKKFLYEAKQNGINDVLCGNLGQLNLCKGLEFKIHGDFGLNIYNNYSAEFYRDYGLKSMILSFELNFNKIKEISSDDTGFIAYGRLPFMIFRNCIKKECHKNEILTDRINKDFLLTCDFGCRNILWNADNLYIADKDLSNLGFSQLVFTDEDSEMCSKIINEYKFKEPIIRKDITRGLYNK
ncbi:MAG: peptidase [Clostridia bacterium]|nr:peptidase [Clostridia bacterium]